MSVKLPHPPLSDSKAHLIPTELTGFIQPGSLSIIRRNGTITRFDRQRIHTALGKAFWDVEGQASFDSEQIKYHVDKLCAEIVSALLRRMPIEGGTLHVEDVQDQVELALMRNEFHLIARSYVLYRDAHQKIREKKVPEKNLEKIILKNTDGSRAYLDKGELKKLIIEACQNLENVAPEKILADTLKNIFEGITYKEISASLIMSARTLIEQEPNYSYVAARLLANDLKNEAHQFLQLPLESEDLEVLKISLQKGVELELINPELLNFDLAELAKAIDNEKNLKFTYLSLQTLYDRYFLHSSEVRFEQPQIFFMRVAMGLALKEPKKEKAAIEFYQLLSSFDYMSSTPTLFNSGTLRPQLSSCYILTIFKDGLEEIYDTIKSNALLSKYAGGLGNDWSPVRALNSRIKGTNGKSQGVVPFMKVANDTAVAVNQGGKRKGAICSYLETWHLDIEEFLELRKNTGDERRRTHDMNTANWVPDLFMKRMIENKNWTLFSPDETPNLHDLYGFDFEKAYEAYEVQAAEGLIKNFKILSAVSLWRKMLSMVFETGHPWITFKDPCNLRSPQQHVGVVHSSNLCTEITLNTSDEEIAVCNIGSINLAQHIKPDGKGLNLKKLKRTVTTAIQMLDNVIDINFYPVEKARTSNIKHRPIGLGLMGFQDALYLQNIPYESDEALEFADRSMEIISYYAIEASANLAEIRGTYSSFKGSLWSQGILPIDSIKKLEATRGLYLDQDTSQTLDWNTLREKVKKVGMRNSNVMAIAPTATISNICGVSQSIEPTYQNLFVKSNLSGEFTIINPYLVKDLKRLGLWDEALVKDLKYFNGSVQQISRVPRIIKQKYKTAFEIDAHWLIDAGSRRQKWIDQSQSLNLYMSAPSGKKLDRLYRSAWLRGLKTTYYLRSLGATDTEKSTVDDHKLNAVTLNQSNNLCSIENPDCESCQ